MFCNKYQYDHMTMSRDTEDDEHDQIEVLSSQIIYLEPPCTPPLSAEDRKKEELEKRNELERRRVSRVVAVVSLILMMLCVALICISFMISNDIDEIVRNSNVLLRKHSSKTTSITEPRNTGSQTILSEHLNVTSS